MGIYLKTSLSSIENKLPKRAWVFKDASYVVDPLTVAVVSVHNTTATNIDITIPGNAGTTLGLPVTVKRYNDTSNGPVTIKASAGAKIAGAGGGFVDSISLPTTDGQRQMTFINTEQNFWELIAN